MRGRLRRLVWSLAHSDLNGTRLSADGNIRCSLEQR